MKFIEDLKWRGMFHDMIPGTEEILDKEMVSAYIGFDPTADSLHVGSFSQIMLLKRFQLAGHKPIIVVGGATGMIGDPSGKSKERNLLDEDSIKKNLEGIKTQLMRFLDFDENKKNCAVIVNNYDWIKDITFLEFIRDYGKHITVNYMMAKDSVKNRISDESKEGMSFTEFTYQLVQGYDFYWLFNNMNCKMQMGGSDQWGNITTGIELIRRKTESKAFALTIPLITKSDGSKFGKTESGNVWLDPEKTTPYAFYQFWLNTSDEDAEKYIKIFTLLEKSEIEDIIAKHKAEPHLRILQKKLAEELTIIVHSEQELEHAIEASSILFGRSTKASLEKIDEKTFLSVFEGVPVFEISAEYFTNGIPVAELLCDLTGIFSSKGELRRLIQGNGLSINKDKFTNFEGIITGNHLINQKYILVQKGKKSYFLIQVVNS